jgi:hypothetical protein
MQNIAYKKGTTIRNRVEKWGIFELKLQGRSEGIHT